MLATSIQNPAGILLSRQQHRNQGDSQSQKDVDVIIGQAIEVVWEIGEGPGGKLTTKDAFRTWGHWDSMHNFATTLGKLARPRAPSFTVDIVHARAGFRNGGWRRGPLARTATLFPGRMAQNNWRLLHLMMSSELSRFSIHTVSLADAPFGRGFHLTFSCRATPAPPSRAEAQAVASELSSDCSLGFLNFTRWVGGYTRILIRPPFG